VLLALCTVLNAEPLLNEPGVTKTHRDYEAYNEIIKYKNIEVAIFGMLASVADPSVADPSVADPSIAGPSVYATTYDDTGVMNEFAIFGDRMREHFQQNKEKIRARVLAGVTFDHNIAMYKLSVKTNYEELLKKFTD